ncbi:unnamed protein product [Allacma fusca]|uniref:DOMON domain-containing protein n=1 Tax=Allacma fusca TaxID=39272 RepID=A0A8J2NJQ1_9HEXA|nr:unnamed protein product [Allacma fusca]
MAIINETYIFQSDDKTLQLINIQTIGKAIPTNFKAVKDFQSFKATCTARSNSVPEYGSNFLKRGDQHSRLPQFNYHQIQRCYFFVLTKTRGFVGFGLTDDGRRADLIIGGIRDDETPYFADRYSATGNGSKIDTRQDWQLHEVMETSDSTLLWFIRSLNTGDTAEDITIIDKETNILWIIGETDDIEGSSSTVGGVNAVNLTPYFADRKGTQNGNTRYINADPSQDYGLLSAREANGVTRLRFIRDFDTGDVNDYVIKYENAHFIWALGTNDALNAHPGGDSRGAFAVNPLLARL